MRRIDIRGNVDPNAAAKDRTEAELRTLVIALLADQYEEVRRSLDETGTVPLSTWRRLRVTMTAALRVVLQGAALTAALRLLPEILGRYPLARQTVRSRIGTWAWAYAFALASELFVVTQRAVDIWLAIGVTPIGSISLDFYFGRARASEIAATQTTYAFNAGERAVITTAKGYGIQTEATWHTMRDELVCEVCAPLDGKVEGDWGPMPSFPPLHEECRCWVTYKGAGDVFWRWQQ